MPAPPEGLGRCRTRRVRKANGCRIKRAKLFESCFDRLLFGSVDADRSCRVAADVGDQKTRIGLQCGRPRQTWWFAPISGGAYSVWQCIFTMRLHATTSLSWNAGRPRHRSFGLRQNLRPRSRSSTAKHLDINERPNPRIDSHHDPGPGQFEALRAFLSINFVCA